VPEVTALVNYIKELITWINPTLRENLCLDLGPIYQVHSKNEKNFVMHQLRSDLVVVVVIREKKLIEPASGVIKKLKLLDR